jgi:hypothetical protein
MDWGIDIFGGDAPQRNYVESSAGEESPFSLSIPWLNNSGDSPPLFPPATLVPDGGFNLAQRSSGDSFWGFDQSKITASLQDVLGSVIQAGGKAAVQLTGDAINKQANGQENSIWTSLARNFTSTKTGTQIQAASLATRAQNIIMNPMVWLAAVGLVILFVVIRK